MNRKKLGIGMVAVALAFPAAGGILTAGAVGAQSLRGHVQHAQTAPQENAAGGTDGGSDTPISLPAGSVSPDQAQQAAVAYVQQTAPYSTQGLTVHGVTVDDEDGTAVFKVTFTGSAGPGAEMTVSTQGQVLKAESNAPDAPDQAGAETPNGAEQDGPGGHADAPGGHANAPGTTESQGGAQQ